MEIQIKVERPRWLRLPQRRSARFALLLVAALAVAVPAAWASDRFADVPTASPHHTDINRIADAGITGGCNPPLNNLYCPADAVRRDQMGSFIARSGGRVAWSHQNYFNGAIPEAGQGSGLANARALRSVTITTGGVAGEFQFVSLHAKVGIYTNTTAASYCPAGGCGWRIDLVDASAPAAVLDDAIWRPIGNSAGDTLSLEAVVRVPTATTKTFTLRQWYEGTFAASSFNSWSESLSAQTAPFGNSGGDVLSLSDAPTGGPSSAGR